MWDDGKGGCWCFNCKGRFPEEYSDRVVLAPDPLHSLFDGWMTMLEPGTDFAIEGHVWTEEWLEEEDEELDPYEAPSPIPVFKDSQLGRMTEIPIPYHMEGMCWSAFSLALQQIAKIIGGRAEAYQHNTYGKDNDGKGPMNQPQYSFKFLQGDSGWQCSEGARL